MTFLYALTATAAVSCFWLGLVFGVSFLATLAKFRASSLTRPVALDVGRHTFRWLGRAEWAVAALLAIALILSGLQPLRTTAFLLLIVVLLAQALWLLPALSARIEVIQSGGTPPPSPLHFYSVAGEAAKLVLLLFIAGAALGDLARLAT